MTALTVDRIEEAAQRIEGEGRAGLANALRCAEDDAERRAIMREAATAIETESRYKDGQAAETVARLREWGDAILTRTEAVDRAEQIKLRYELRIMEILRGYAQTFREAGYEATEPFDMSADDYRWTFSVNGNDLPESIDVTFEIAESAEHESSEPPYGVNFAIDLVAYGGLIVGGLMPYNYTDECWCPLEDDDAIEQRFSILENSSPLEAVACVEEYREREAMRPA